MSNLQIIIDIVLAIGGVLYAISQWNKGRDDKSTSDLTESEKTINLLKERANALEKALEESRKVQSQDHDSLIRLEESLKHAKEDNKRLTDIFQGRDPEQTEKITNIIIAQKEQSELLKMLVELVKKLLAEQNKG
jgi:hypothetical protein